jgi:ABC-2 type transport system permease protein
MATLYRREIRRYVLIWEENLGGAVVTALLFFVVFRLALEGAPDPLPGIGLSAFLAPGLVLVAAGQTAFAAGANWILHDKLEGTIGDVLTPPLSAAERVAAFAFGAATAGALSGTAVAAVVLPFAAVAWEAPMALLFFLAAGALLHGLAGVLVGLWAERWDQLSAAETFLLVPAIYMSAAFFPASSLPETWRAAILLNPAFYAVDGLRYGFLGRSEGDPLIAAAVLVALDLALFGLAWVLFRRGWKLVR